MENKNIEQIKSGLTTAFIDQSNNSNLAYRPEFVYNDYKQGKKVLVSLEQELKRCDEFFISVAFITDSGFESLAMILKELERKGIPGKILTTDYLTFSQPKALDRLAQLSNIELKMYRTNSEVGGFHTKGYIFREDELYRIIIGSSNMTSSAITKNREWNTKIVSTEQGEVAQEILAQFNELWDSPNSQVYEDFIEDYKIKYLREKMIQKQHKAAMQDQVVEIERYKLTPNKMQIAFIDNLTKLRLNNAEKALLVSSTGTGKTLASAFAVREMNSARILFIVHREQIAKQALNSYRKVFGNERTFGLISGNYKDMDADYIFSTMQMMSKSEVYTQFNKEDFDIIVLDECHHAGSNSYQKIMSYFKPKFWLGMTASPDTNNYDIYELFDHNIAYEIRLQQALEEDLLCPFHYFGIIDLEINGEIFDDNTGLRNFANLICDDRVDYIIQNAEYFGYSGDRVKGLIFCSRKEEAKELSQKFNCRYKKNGELYKTEVLTGEDNQQHREEVIKKLTAEKSDGEAIDYIFTIDIFNEGVDIPEINQVIMLRPTESPVIFIQQLGRGLRKYKEKEYVVVLDFIGNYMNNFMIPIALSGDRSYNKDNMRRYVREGSRMIPGSSKIHFDEISKKRIYASIDKARTNDLKLLKDSYTTLKYKLGRIPSILEFKKYGSIDVTKIFDKCGSYYTFLKKYEKDYTVNFSKEKEQVIEYMSKKLVSYKRIHELALLQFLINQQERLTVYYQKFMKLNYGLNVSSITEESVYRNLTNQFPKESEQKKYSSCVLLEREEDGSYKIAPDFQKMLEDEQFKDMVMDLLKFGEEESKEHYSDLYKDTCFQLYQKYNYEDVCRLLGWKQNLNAQNIGGYFYDTDTKTMPVFINYDKADDAIAYEDRFISENILIALSKHPRKITSKDVDHIYKKKAEDKDNRIFLFVRKNKEDNEKKEFYFLGEIYAEGDPKPIHMESTNDDAFEILYRLDIPVRNDIYDYIVRD